MKKSQVLLYRNPYWRYTILKYRGVTESWDRVIQSIAPVDYLEAIPRLYLGPRMNKKYREKKLVPGLLKGLGRGYFDIPIAVRISDLVSFRSRGGFLQREYKLILENKIRFVTPVDLVLHPTKLYPYHVTFQELRELTPPPELTAEEQDMKRKLEFFMTTHIDREQTYGPKYPFPLWLKEEGGVV